MEVVTKVLGGAKSLYFFLPDGAYGRPFDLQYYFESASGLEIKLKDDVSFVFQGLLKIAHRPPKLIITGFTNLVFRDGEESRTYPAGGDVKFHIF